MTEKHDGEHTTLSLKVKLPVSGNPKSTTCRRLDGRSAQLAVREEVYKPKAQDLNPHLMLSAEHAEECACMSISTQNRTVFLSS